MPVDLWMANMDFVIEYITKYYRNEWGIKIVELALPAMQGRLELRVVDRRRILSELRN